MQPQVREHGVQQGSTLEIPKGLQPCPHLDSPRSADFVLWPPELEEDSFLLD
jgi:hypothetical protein